MRNFILIVVVFVFNQVFVLAQTDTSYLYFNKDWKNCKKDTAFYYAKVYKDGKLWTRKDYWVKENILQMKGSYLKKDCKTQEGLFNWYKDNGVLEMSKLYEKGHTRKITLYYGNGSKKAVAFYDGDRRTEAKGWDENGKEIPNFVFEKEATFPGGLAGWKRYLETNLVATVAAEANAPIGMYSVKVQFIVSKEGVISNVKAISVPKKCAPCGVEAVRVISNAPQWEPAIHYNKNVLYQAIQHISFQVAKD